MVKTFTPLPFNNSTTPAGVQGFKESNPEAKVGEFIKFLPVLAYDGSSMKEIDAQDVLDIALAGTSATLLAKRWESALLVNVDNDTLKRLLANDDAMKALMNIEGFRNLNNDLTTIINKSEEVKKAKEKKNNQTSKEKKELTEKEKELKRKIMSLELEHNYSKALPIVTVSQGMCWDVPVEGSRVWDYLHKADEMLYRVKKHSRNNYCIGHLRDEDEVVIGD